MDALAGNVTIALRAAAATGFVLAHSTYLGLMLLGFGAASLAALLVNDMHNVSARPCTPPQPVLNSSTAICPK